MKNILDCIFTYRIGDRGIPKARTVEYKCYVSVRSSYAVRAIIDDHVMNVPGFHLNIIGPLQGFFNE